MAEIILESGCKSVGIPGVQEGGVNVSCAESNRNDVVRVRKPALEALLSA